MRFRMYLQNIDIFLDSSMVERTAVNRDVVGSSPTQGVEDILYEVLPENSKRGFPDKAPWSSG